MLERFRERPAPDLTRLLEARGDRQPAPARGHRHARGEVKIYPRAILSAPGTSGCDISYNRVLRAVLHKPLRWGYLFNRGHGVVILVRKPQGPVSTRSGSHIHLVTLVRSRARLDGPPNVVRRVLIDSDHFNFQENLQERGVEPGDCFLGAVKDVR